MGICPAIPERVDADKDSSLSVWHRFKGAWQPDPKLFEGNLWIRILQVHLRWNCIPGKAECCLDQAGDTRRGFQVPDSGLGRPDDAGIRGTTAGANGPPQH
jgi:hypothetical protein